MFGPQDDVKQQTTRRRKELRRRREEGGRAQTGGDLLYRPKLERFTQDAVYLWPRGSAWTARAQAILGQAILGQAMAMDRSPHEFLQ